MTYRLSIVLLLLSVALGSGCKGEVTVEDIEGWIKARKYVKVNEFIGNTENSMDMRVKAVALLVDYGSMPKLQAALDEVKDRDAFVPAVTKMLLEALESDDLDEARNAKDAIFAILKYHPDKKRDELIKAVAKWVYGDLSFKSSRKQIVERMTNANILGQLSQMGDHGIPPAAWLISYGIETQELLPVLREARSPKNQRLAVEAVRRLFENTKNLKVSWEMLGTVRGFALPETVQLFVDVYMTSRLEDEMRSSALAAAQDLIYQRLEGTDSVTDTPEKRKVVLAAIEKLFKSTVATDRWDAAQMILDVGGVKELDRVLKGFKDDLSSYIAFTPQGERELPDVLITRLCAHKIRAKADVTRPKLEAMLSKGDRVQKAWAILCLKVVGEPVSIDKLKTVVGDTTSLEDFFFTRKERAQRKKEIEAEKRQVLTVGLLAQNAIDGIQMFGEIEKQRTEGKLTDKEAELLGLAAVGVISFAGDAYRAAVDLAYRKKRAKAGLPPLPEKKEEPKEGDDKKDAKDKKKRGK